MDFSKYTKNELYNVIMNINSRLIHGDVKDYYKDELQELVTNNNIALPDFNLLKQRKKELKAKYGKGWNHGIKQDIINLSK